MARKFAEITKPGKSGSQPFRQGTRLELLRSILHHAVHESARKNLTERTVGICGAEKCTASLIAEEMKQCIIRGRNRPAKICLLRATTSAPRQVSRLTKKIIVQRHGSRVVSLG